MKFRVVLAAITLLIFAGVSTFASAGENKRDPKAMDVLHKMAAYTDSLDQFVFKAEVFADARLEGGLMVSNPSEVKVVVDRPGSFYLQSFDGVDTKQIYIHKGMLTLYGTAKNFYARTKVPENIEEAMQYAIEEYDLDLPLVDLIFAKSAIELVTDQDSIHYLTDKSRIGGVDCHHIVIRGSEVDLQLWVDESDKPTVRKMVMTMKWEGGSPRRIALMEVSEKDKLDSKVFEFKPPEGAQEIKFYGVE